ADEAVANEQAMAAKAIKDECDADLAEAIPILESAMAALNTLTTKDIGVVKQFGSPPAVVKLIIEAVCVLKGIKPEKMPDPSGSDMKFLTSLIEFDKDNIPAKNIKQGRPSLISLCRSLQVGTSDRVVRQSRKSSRAKEGKTKRSRSRTCCRHEGLESKARPAERGAR
ncbi:unnamed protein product, partial [Oikopleura dioica]